MRAIRQGDVLVVVKGGAKPTGKLKQVERENGRVILAHGEVTGHAHAILEPGVDLFEDESGKTFLLAKEDAVLRHEEHRRDVGNHKGGYPVIEKSTKYIEVRRQREYLPGEVPQNVAD